MTDWAKSWALLVQALQAPSQVQAPRIRSRLLLEQSVKHNDLNINVTLQEVHLGQDYGEFTIHQESTPEVSETVPSDWKVSWSCLNYNVWTWAVRRKDHLHVSVQRHHMGRKRKHKKMWHEFRCNCELCSQIPAQTLIIIGTWIREEMVRDLFW